MDDANISNELDGGMFGLTTPTGWGGWIIFVLGFILSVIGILTLLGFLQDPPLPILTAVGVLLIAFSSPTKLQKTLRELRAKTLPSDVNWQQQKGGTELTSFWNSATINRPKVNDRSWVFPAPKREKWHLENRYAADEPEELIQEHPNKIGTPRPPTISNYALATPIAFSLLAYQLIISMVEEEQILIYILKEMTVLHLHLEATKLGI